MLHLSNCPFNLSDTWMFLRSLEISKWQTELLIILFSFFPPRNPSPIFFPVFMNSSFIFFQFLEPKLLKITLILFLTSYIGSLNKFCPLYFKCINNSILSNHTYYSYTDSALIILYLQYCINFLTNPLYLHSYLWWSIIYL